MSETKVEAVGSSAAGAPTKKRRGVSNQTQAVSQLKFHEKDASPQGLFIGHLDEVRVDWSTNADGKTFTGMKIPRLTFHFASNHTKKEERRHVYQSLFPVESNVDTMEGGKEDWKVNNVFNWIKHILDVFYLKGRSFTEAEEDALSLAFCDSDDDGNYVPVEPEEVIGAYAALFTNAAAMLNGTFGVEGGEGKPCYKDANGNFIKVWMKLLRHTKYSRNKGWVNVTPNGDLGFDTFIRSGVIEIQKPNTPPAILRIDVSKESITPKETKKAPTVGGVNPMVGGAAYVDTGMPSIAGDESAFAAAGEEMPF